ncbi:HET-domain-containing protein [Corynespora cassiicola Philippines]|uniref:HET-domain-containing protein n=1 Tax=Corynespora cassiicola Philippines TaxID=1448308 RepID=A0A2T2N4Y7_CORCC|nr:HET-domain-containing protein [Corynespora cassiicola Philippines]
MESLSSHVPYRPDLYDVVKSIAENSCAVFPRIQYSLDAQNFFKIYPQTLIECTTRGCAFCSLVLRGFAQFRGVPLNFRFWKQKQGKALKVAGDYIGSNTNRDWLVYEIYRSLGDDALDFQKPQVHSIPRSLTLSRNETALRDYDVLSWIGICSDIAEHGRDSECLQRASLWLNHCIRTHDACSSDSIAPNTFPKRMIHVGDSSTPPQLCSFPPKYHKERSYAALSHCWGKAPPYTTTHKTLVSRSRALAWSEIPKTFRDAILVTRALELKYLWIDSLCIIQDDKTDWKEEAAKMCHVYSNAVVTIVASSASDSSKGFLQEREHLSKTIMSIRGERPIKMREDIHYHFSTAGPLVDRGWCFQERMLARRLLMFEKHEMVWRCKIDHRCECGSALEEARYLTSTRYDSSKFRTKTPATPRDFYNIISHKDKVEETYRWWHGTVVPYYTVLQLSKWTDRFPALSGLATAVDSVVRGTYLAGIWKEKLANGLLWKASKCGFVYEDIAPSWSWASISSPILYTSDLVYDKDFQGLIDEITHDMKASPEDRFGALRPGSNICIKCPLFHADALWSVAEKSGSVEGLNFADYSCRPSIILDACTEAIEVNTPRGKMTTLARCKESAEMHKELGLEALHNLCARSSDVGFGRAKVAFAVLGVSLSNYPELRGIVLGSSNTVPGAYQRVGYWTAYINRGFLAITKSNEVLEATKAFGRDDLGLLQNITII